MQSILAISVFSSVSFKKNIYLHSRSKDNKIHVIYLVPMEKIYIAT